MCNCTMAAFDGSCGCGCNGTGNCGKKNRKAKKKNASNPLDGIMSKGAADTSGFDSERAMELVMHTLICKREGELPENELKTIAADRYAKMRVYFTENELEVTPENVLQYRDAILFSCDQPGILPERVKNIWKKHRLLLCLLAVAVLMGGAYYFKYIRK